MKRAAQTLILLLSTTLHLASSFSEVCFIHNTTTDYVYIQCGDLQAAEHLPEYAEHSEIQSIQIGWNTSIPMLDYGLFTRFKYLSSLSLNNANIETIGPRAFYGLEQVQELSLYNNKISKIDSTTFAQLYILRILNLGQNKIEHLHEDTFSSLYQLETLILKWNNIQNITKGIFNGLRALQVLDLRGNKVTTLNSDVFEELYFLKSLDLSFNSLKEIPSTLFCNQKSLLSLTLESNGIKNLPDKVFENTNRLQFIDVSNNLLTHFQENILNNTEVEILKFTRNHIATINATSLLSYTQYLVEVDLAFNPWHCQSLKDAIDEFEKSQVYFKPETEVEGKHNFRGITCRQQVLEEKAV